jgi:hypothetical protein
MPSIRPIFDRFIIATVLACGTDLRLEIGGLLETGVVGGRFAPSDIWRVSEKGIACGDAVTVLH